MIKLGWFCGIILLITACTSQPSPENIPPQVVPHVKEFMAQAHKRGVSINSRGLTIAFVDHLTDEKGNPVNGRYIRWKFNLGPERIELDTTQVWWIGPTTWADVTYSREKVIFHELAHCFLNRKHKFDLLPNGMPASIMGVTILPTYDVNPHQRKYYLDELFNQNTSIPCWAKNERCP